MKQIKAMMKRIDPAVSWLNQFRFQTILELQCHAGEMSFQESKQQKIREVYYRFGTASCPHV